MENLVTLPHLQSYYKGKKVFITGHTGFKGAWLSAVLHLAGARVMGYALEPEYPNSLFERLQPLRITEGSIADIRDRERLQKELRAFQPDFIFHLAAQPLVRRSYEIPAETFDVNVTGTANLLEAASKLEGSCTIIVITTDKVYENREKNILYTEEDALGGFDPYSASKAAAELVVNAFRNSFFHPGRFAVHKKSVATARAGNVLGGGDWSRDRIIPDIVRALQENREVDVRNPGAVRPWQHVLEPIGGYLLLGARLQQGPSGFPKAFNFGPQAEDHLSVREVVELAIACWGEGRWNTRESPNAPHEAGLLQLDIGRALAELQWKPKLNSAEAVRWTIDWYRQPADRQALFTFDQIKTYLSL
ncbi:MAG: CDP-glucose 4,6-dehydratase [Puia sp.]|nr:CDP-glucose 4,6-dehydratase [Puia sp.]